MESIPYQGTIICRKEEQISIACGKGCIPNDSKLECVFISVVAYNVSKLHKQAFIKQML